MLLCFFFLIFGTLLLRLFGVPLSMVRIVGGIILMKIGFELFSPAADKGSGNAATAAEGTNIAFVPLAMPLMFGPGAIATVLGMASNVRHEPGAIFSLLAISAAVVATFLCTYLCLVYAERLTRWFGPLGLDAATRIVGFFVSAMGVGLIVDGVIEALQSHGLAGLH